MITISDIHGARQYTLNQFIKVIAMWLVLLLVVVLIVGSIFLKVLSDKADETQIRAQQAEEKTQLAQKQTLTAQKLIISLAKQQQSLQKNITAKSEELTSMNTHLSEIEDLLGLDRDIDMSLENRTDYIKYEANKKIEKEKLSFALINILNRSIPNGEPIAYKHVSSKFGYRKHPITKKRSFHAGLDLSAPKGTPIYATADGVVEYAKTKGGYGKYILINHPLGFKTAYAHLSKYAVKMGQYVQKNELIGYVGNTGKSTGPHLHYEILYLHKWLNPSKYMQWNHENYATIMNEEKKVNWDALMGYINTRLQTELALN